MSTLQSQCPAFLTKPQLIKIQQMSLLFYLFLEGKNSLVGPQAMQTIEKNPNNNNKIHKQTKNKTMTHCEKRCVVGGHQDVSVFSP